MANLHANARNHGVEVAAVLEAVPRERLAYVHVAVGVKRGALYHDTHAHPVPPQPLQLLASLVARVGPVPALLERDDHFPSTEELSAELDALRAALTPRPAYQGCGAMSARERLARAQAELARALGQGAPVPEGFDVERVQRRRTRCCPSAGGWCSGRGPGWRRPWARTSGRASTPGPGKTPWGPRAARWRMGGAWL